jgi:hypothetical protein
MIFFNFTIRNPFRVKDFPQIDYICYDRKITKNKCIKLQFTKWPANRIFEVSLDTCWIGQDHGGIRFDLEVFGYFFNISLYDHRHWDYVNHCWEVYDEENIE